LKQRVKIDRFSSVSCGHGSQDGGVDLHLRAVQSEVRIHRRVEARSRAICEQNSWAAVFTRNAWPAWIADTDFEAAKKDIASNNQDEAEQDKRGRGLPLACRR
jgi:hypothetical protein